jgi:L-cysteine/cystine lyase
MTDINQVRDMLPGVQDTVWLNTGTCGPLPTVAYDAMHAELMSDLTKARIDQTHFPHIFELRSGVREAVAVGLGVPAEDIAITNRTTEGMYVAIMGYPWRAGDELILSNIEHPGGLLPAFLAKKRFGVRLRIADVGLGGGDPAEIVRAFEQKITPRTRMIVISHVSYTTGATLPVQAIAEMARSHDVLMAVDAAQSFGAFELDAHALGVDFYACPGQKWMCGPDGSGSLYVRPESLGEIEQNFAGGIEWGPIDYYGGTYVPARGGERFDTGGWNLGVLAGQQAATSWIVNDLGMAWTTGRIQQLANHTYDELARLKGVSIVTPREALAGLIAFNVEGVDGPTLTERLATEHNVTIRYVTKCINNPDAARVSVGFYNTEEDIAKFTDGIQAIQKSL